MTATGEMRRSTGRMRLGRPRRLAISGFAAVLGLLLVGLGFPVAPPAANAVDQSLPTWADVEAAKQNEAAAAAKVTEIQQLLVRVQAEVERTRLASEDAAAKAQQAQTDYAAAYARAETLAEQAEKSRQIADEASAQAASLVSQMYRSGGVDRSVELFLESDADTSEQLLQRLATMSKATERNTVVSEEAQRATNSAESLTEQAETAAAERDRLLKEAEQAQAEAAAAAETARQQLVEQEAQAETLQLQLTALQDKTVSTTEGYQERQRQEEADRQEAIRRAQEEAAAGGGGSGGGGGGGGGAWTVPIWNGYWISDVWGAGRDHLGIDLATGAGTPIHAASSGTVTFSGWWPYCGGYMVEISHGGGFKTWYAHQNGPPIVGNGQWVSTGQVIGYVGASGCATGPHLHFATLQNSMFIEPQGAMAQRGIYF